jgi:hypothetical protein
VPNSSNAAWWGSRASPRPQGRGLGGSKHESSLDRSTSIRYHAIVPLAQLCPLMKAICLACVMCLGLVSSSHGQGQVVFNNRVVATLLAPIFGPEPSDATIENHGNPPDIGPARGFPPGTQTYGGAPLAGTGYTAQLWGGPLGSLPGNPLIAPLAGTDPILQPVAVTAFRTGAASGFFRLQSVEPFSIALVPGVLPGERASFEVRVWDNQGGMVTDWFQVLADPTIPRGQSGFFSPPGVLGGTDEGGIVLLPAYLQGLESFNIHTVPEPSLTWLALGALGAFWAAGRRPSPRRRADRRRASRI